MNKKEIAELKRLFHPDRCPLTRICGCYVDAEKTKKAYLKEAFLSLPEEEMYKYYDIFKKSMSGTIGKNLLNMEFPLETEADGGTQEFLMRLKASQLKDDALLDEFYDKVIEHFLYPENYYIVLVHGTYDIPKRASDGLEMFDASDDVYEFLLCAICPVNLTKPGLCYNTVTNQIEERTRDWFVEVPVTGFLFPAFNDRNTDLHSVLYYSKNPDELNSEFAHLLLGCELPMTAKNQKAAFNQMVAESLEDDCTFETVKTIHETLETILEEHKDDPEPVMLDTSDMKRLLSEHGAKEENIEKMDRDLEMQGIEPNSTSLLVSNVVNKRKFEIKTPNIVISVKPECAGLIETRVIDGRTCFIIPADDSVQVNGIPIKTAVLPED